MCDSDDHPLCFSQILTYLALVVQMFSTVNDSRDEWERRRRHAA